jgi:hypothetical protein
MPVDIPRLVSFYGSDVKDTCMNMRQSKELMFPSMWDDVRTWTIIWA